MNASPAQTPLYIYAVIAAIIVLRYSCPMKMSIARLLVAPIIFLALTAISIYGSPRLFSARLLI